MNTYLTYIGKEKGSIPGIPARDLTREEAEKYGIEKLLKSGLYKVHKDLSEMIVISEDFEEERPKRTYRRRKE